MEKIQFYICDVFGIGKYTGNQLAVFIDNGNISSEQMQQMAAEINFSESTFINPNANPDGSFNVRIFTPKAEVDFAGHPCLGSAYIIHNKLKNPLINKVLLNLKVGIIPVQNENPLWWMQQVQPSFGKVFNRTELSKTLNVNTEDISESYPVEEVSTGLPFLIVPIKSMDALKRAKVQVDHYKVFTKETKTKGIMIFCPKGHNEKQQIGARVFVPLLGIPEDPATGSANGCLAAYLIKNNFFNSQQLELTIGQGYEMGRPSQISIKANRTDNFYNLQVGGLSQEVAEGQWFL